MYKVFLDGNEIKLGEQTFLWQNRITSRLRKRPVLLLRFWLYHRVAFRVEQRGYTIHFIPPPPKGVNVQALYEIEGGF